MNITSTQRSAVEFIYNNPGATLDEIVTAAGATTDPMAFLSALVSGGLAQVVISPEVDQAMEDGEF